MTVSSEVGSWLEALAEVADRHTVAGSGSSAADPPDRKATLELLAWLGVPESEVAPLLRTFPDPDDEPVLWQALTRCDRALRSGIGRILPPIPWPAAPAELDESGRYFFAHLYLQALPATLEWHRSLAIPEETSRDTFADLSTHLALHRRRFGTGGLDQRDWLVRHFRGTLFRLGRLQFNRAVLRESGTPVLEVHVPGDGPLRPALCEQSYRAAPGFFTRHLGEEYDSAICDSWLLDPQLAEKLPPEANIVAFQRRYRTLPQPAVADADVLLFVFDILPGTGDAATLQGRTTLERAIITHLLDGGHWYSVTGWTHLPEIENQQRPL